MKISYKVEFLPEDLQVRGNAISSGDEETDKRVEDEIIRRLDRDDISAWFCAKVTCTVVEGDYTFNGVDFLGACSYNSEQEFLESDVVEDMKKEAYSGAVHSIREAVARGQVAQELQIKMAQDHLKELQEKP